MFYILIYGSSSMTVFICQNLFNYILKKGNCYYTQIVTQNLNFLKASKEKKQMQEDYPFSLRSDKFMISLNPPIGDNIQ